MSNLVYLASGQYRDKYECLDVDNIYLVDTSIKNRASSKVHTLKLDALDSLDYFRRNNIKINYLVTLRESQGEGGYTYNLCSDAVIGYFMTILPQNFIWICNDVTYYTGLFMGKKNHIPYVKNPSFRNNLNLVSLNLPYTMTELSDEDDGFINPVLFTDLVQGGKIHVFQMDYHPLIHYAFSSTNFSIRVIQDSIWKHQDELDHSYISFSPSYSPKRNFYTDTFPKATYYLHKEFREKLEEAIINGDHHIGFTPHFWYQYDSSYQKALESVLLKANRPIIIDFYFMNGWFKYRFIKKAVSTLSRQSITKY